MPQGTVKTVYPIVGRQKPGAVVFQDGQKFTTFDAAVMRDATGTEGQLVEYTTKTEGKYTNLAGIRVLGAAVPVQQASRVPAAPVSDGELVRVLQYLGDTIRSLREVVERASAALAQPYVAPPALGFNGDLVPGALTPVSDDPIVARQSLLAGKLGAAQAEASINALRKRHAKSPEKLLAAVDTLLTVNGIEAPAW